jgi:hypothetical protein
MLFDRYRYLNLIIIFKSSIFAETISRSSVNFISLR